MQNNEATRRCHKSIAREVEQLKKDVNSTREMKYFCKWGHHHYGGTLSGKTQDKRKDNLSQKLGVGIVAPFGISTKSILAIGHCLGVDMSC
jgi:hypothetical protein